MKTIGDRIRERRKELDMSAEDMAEKLGKNRATIYRYESGDIKTLPSDVLEPIARVLQTTPADLLGYSDPREMIRTESFSENEIKLINKYRDLDAHGRDMVDTVAEKEHERCSKEHLLPLAAHHESDRYSDVQKDKIKDRIREISDSE